MRRDAGRTQGHRGATDEQLVAEIRAGETGAFDELYRRYSRRLFGYIRRYVFDRDEAEDLIQEVFLSVLRDRRFDLERGRFAGWLFTVARNRCLTHLRDARREAEKREALAGVTDGEQRQNGTLEQLRQILASLPEAHQDALLLKEVAELTYREIALVQGIPEGTVKSRLHHAVRAIQRGLIEGERA